MVKTYRSPIVLSVRTADGTRVTFEELSGGQGGTFSTADPHLQEQLEKHPLFNYRFKVHGTAAAPQKKVEAEAEPETVEVIKVQINDPGEAKEYLADHFQISRTRLRTKEQILASAKANNVEFVGL